MVGVSYVTEADILDERGVDVAALLNLLEEGVDEVFEAGVLETALAGLCEGSSDGKSDDNIVGVLGLAAKWPC